MQAAELARSRSAWAEALRLYERALGLTELVEGLARDEEPRLHEAAMEAAFGDSNLRATVRHGLTALDAYRELSDPDGQARVTACLTNGPFLPPKRQLSLIGDALTFEDGPGDRAVRAWLLALQAIQKGRDGQGDADAAAELLKTTTSLDATLSLMHRKVLLSYFDHDPGAYTLVRGLLDISLEGGANAGLFFLFLAPMTFERRASTPRFVPANEPVAGPRPGTVGSASRTRQRMLRPS